MLDEKEGLLLVCFMVTVTLMHHVALTNNTQSLSQFLGSARRILYKTSHHRSPGAELLLT